MTMNDDKRTEFEFIDELQRAKFRSLKVPDSFLDAVRCKTAYGEYQDWVTYLREELEKLYADVIRNGLPDEDDENE